MKELSLHLLDIVQNSVRGKADKIEISVLEKPDENLFEMVILDNGKGISREVLQTVKNPFTTSRTTRRVGLGLPLLDDTCSMCNGRLNIESSEGIGTKVMAVMDYDHIDRPPLGDIATTLMGLFVSYDNINFIYKHIYNNEEFIMDINEIRQILDGVPLTTPDVYKWSIDYINDNIKELKNNNDKNLTIISSDNNK